MKRSDYIRICLVPRMLVTGMILVYQHLISPAKNALLGPGGCCRFYPTCSEYAIGSVRKHGALKGLIFTLIRLIKCHPFHPGGYDPVKPLTSRYQSSSEPRSLLDFPGQH